MVDFAGGHVVVTGGTGALGRAVIGALRAGNAIEVARAEKRASLSPALEARPPSVEGKHEVTQRDLVRNALRMRHSGGKFGDRLHDRDVVELLQRPLLSVTICKAATHRRLVPRHHALRIEIADTATLGAGLRVNHRVH